MPINNNILNQKGTPAFYSDIFANRPAFGYAGRVFISTNTGQIFEDTGTSWVVIADAGAGTTGTLQQVTTNGNTTTLGIQVQNIDINIGAGTGTGNVVFGNASLQGNTTGFNNTAIGNNSLVNNTTGSSNTAIGRSNLQSNTTGISNTSVGANSLQLNTTGANNTGIGATALYANTTGANNSAVGYVSLAANTTGGGNAALGFQSLTNNTTGTNNSSVGSGALSNNTTGISNTAIGQSSLAANITGSYNVALGVGTLGNNLGSYNVGIGHSSLNAVTTGTNNSAIGYASGSAITTGSNNTIIGGYGGTTTLSSNIVLSDGAGNVRLFSDANGLIGIGQAVGTPGGQLDIHTTQTYALVLNGLSTSNAYTAFSNASVGQWRIGNTYSAGANTFDIFNLGTSSSALSFNKTTNVGTFINKVNINNATNVATLSIANSGGGNNMGLSLQNTGSGGATFYIWPTATLNGEGANRLIFGSLSYNNILTFNNATGNVLINSTNDDTVNKLQVNGGVIATKYYIGSSQQQILSDIGVIGVLTTKTYTFSCSDPDNTAFCDILVSASINNRGNSFGQFIVSGQIGSASVVNYAVQQVFLQNNTGTLANLCLISSITKSVGSFSFTIINSSANTAATVLLRLVFSAYNGNVITYTIT